MSGDHIPSSDPAVGRKSAALPNGERRSTKGVKVDDVASTITGDLLMLLHKNFHIPNDVVTTVPKRSDRASLPPPGYLTISETSLRAGLRFPPPAELVEILRRCGVCLSQAMSVIVGLIALFRDRGTVLTPEHLSRMGRLTSDMQGRVTFRCKWLDMHTRDPAKSWSSSYFFVRNDWGLLEKWGKMRDLPAPLHVGEEDIMRLLKVSDVEHLLYEVCYLNKYIEEEFLFKVGLSFHPGKSDARMLKLTSKVPEPPVPVPKAASKRQVGGEDPQVLLKKKKLEGVTVNTGKVVPVSSPIKIRVPGDVLSHQCVGRRKADNLVRNPFLVFLFFLFWNDFQFPSSLLFQLSRRTELEAELTRALNKWNAEFVRIMYLQGEFKQKNDQRTREDNMLEEELSGYRTELENIVQSVSLQNQQLDRLQVDLERAQAMIIQLREDQRASGEKVAVLEAENKRSQTLIAKKEAALMSFESSRVIEDFKKLIAFKIIIQDHVQEACDHIYEVNVKALEQQCLDDGFIRGFLKGVRLMQRKTGVEVEGLTPSQASDDFPPGSDGDEIESELQKAFALEADDEMVDIE
ncbi:hypothetical protein IEQ34_022961 [Dendrobium chrysotoxum]|uniref:Uncharacterized protein n=1 Tax=Dendrobium chrysotoxum TaxID=161865 RepID=A0AAV7FYK1_DENCH|nr:hypothetical protein IEQ34_022961 [Dendrobium chrysotoxum]